MFVIVHVVFVTVHTMLVTVRALLVKERTSFITACTMQRKCLNHSALKYIAFLTRSCLSQDGDIESSESPGS